MGSAIYTKILMKNRFNMEIKVGDILFYFIILKEREISFFCFVYLAINPLNGIFDSAQHI